MSEPSQPAAARASDADRDRTVERLSRAATDGRLEVDELEERLQRATTARTQAELEPLVADLPESDLPRAEPRSTFIKTESSGAPVVGFVLSILGTTKHVGRWRLKEALSAFTILGDTELDLTDAEASATRTTLLAVTILGELKVRVPECVAVDVSSIPILGDHEVSVDSATPIADGAPRIRLRLITILGSASVLRGRTRKSKRRGGN